MRFLYYLFTIISVVQRSSASYPHHHEHVEPAYAVVAEPIAHVDVAPSPVAPVVAPAPVVETSPIVAVAPIVAPTALVEAASVVAPAPVYHEVIPQIMHYHHHYPRAEVRNVVRAYAKGDVFFSIMFLLVSGTGNLCLAIPETGHTSDTAMVSEDDRHDHHGFGVWDHFPIASAYDHRHNHHDYPPHHAAMLEYSPIGYYPLGHFFGDISLYGPRRAFLNRQKLADKKVSRSFEKKN
ncbi:hypothetical protein ANCDUO_00799 [Ancylostoma duodenale]|uniref:Uncharacterized protein n=1 Tax=Ancylostoma duodenale TaxID=51022 RepID=A0A0C2HGV9_9BILA|nr:hypothetical protein ANCDUO_00799 [Ancylostoma duodenale]